MTENFQEMTADILTHPLFQLTGSLLRRAATQPAARYLGPCRALLRQWLEEENYLQRFIPLCLAVKNILRKSASIFPCI